jgi:hypothetical protein
VSITILLLINVSTAVHKKIAESYATDKLYRGKKPIMVVIRAPEKTKGLYIGSETTYHGGNEYEFLFPRGTVFRALEKSESYILLEVVR